MIGAGKLIARNSAANLVRGSASAVVALALPHFLAHRLDPARFSAWALMLQIAALAGYLDFGLQTAISRFVAQTTESQDWARRQQMVGAALALLLAAGIVAALALGVVLWRLPQLLPGLPAGLRGELTTATAILGLAACVQLPLSTYTGMLIGVHRNELPALAIGVSRVLGAVGVIVAARYTVSLVLLGAVLAVCNLAGGLVQMEMVRRVLGGVRVSARCATRPATREVAGYCAGLAVFSIGMLLVSGLDLTIVGHYRFREVGSYAVTGLLVTFLAGVNSAVISAMITPMAMLAVRGEQGAITSVTLRVTRLLVLLNFGSCFLAWLAGSALLRLWVGDGYAPLATRILDVLMLAQAIRLTVGGYSATLIAVGEQNKGIASGAAEAGVNLLASLLGAAWFGAVGVAYGTLGGAVAGVAWMLIGVMPSVVEVSVRPLEFLAKAVLPPLACVAPLGIAAILVPAAPLLERVALLGLATLLTLGLAIRLDVVRWKRLVPVHG